MADTSSYPRIGHGVAHLQVDPGTVLGGYGERSSPSTGTLDALEVSAVSVSHQGSTAVVCVADVVSVNRDVADSTRVRVAELAGTTPDLVWLAATHTHAGPDTGCTPRGGVTPPPWDDVLPAAAVAAAERALEAAVPADLTVHIGELTHVGGQRAGETKALTAPVAALGVRRPDDGRLLGAVTVLAVHPTVLAATNLSVSADLTGGVRRALRAELATEREAAPWSVVATGVAGDMSTRPHRRAQTAAEVDRLAGVAAPQLRDLLATTAVRRFDAARPLAGAHDVVELASRAPMSREQAEGARARAQARHDDAVRCGDVVGAREAATALQGVALTEAAAGDGAAVPCVVSALDLGGVLLFGLGAEPYSALAARAALTVDGAVVLGYTNGYCGYLPTSDAFGREDYEVLISPVAAGESERALDRSVALLTAGRSG